MEDAQSKRLQEHLRMMSREELHTFLQLLDQGTLKCITDQLKIIFANVE